MTTDQTDAYEQYVEMVSENAALKKRIAELERESEERRASLKWWMQETNRISSDIAAERKEIAEAVHGYADDIASDPDIPLSVATWLQESAAKIEQGGFAPQNIRDSRIANAQKGDGE